MIKFLEIIVVLKRNDSYIFDNFSWIIRDFMYLYIFKFGMCMEFLIGFIIF